MAEAKTEQDPSIEEILESIRQIISDDAEKAQEEPAAATAAEAAKSESAASSAPAPESTSESAPAAAVDEPVPVTTPIEIDFAEDAPSAPASAPVPQDPVPESAPQQSAAPLDLVDVVEDNKVEDDTVENDTEEPVEGIPLAAVSAALAAEDATVTAPAPDNPDFSSVEVNVDEDALLSAVTADAAAGAMAKLLGENIAVERELPGRVGKITLEDLARDMMRPLVKAWLDENLPTVVEKMVAKEIERLARRAMDR